MNIISISETRVVVSHNPDKITVKLYHVFKTREGIWMYGSAVDVVFLEKLHIMSLLTRNIPFYLSYLCKTITIK